MADVKALDELIVEQMPDALICSDADGTITRWNEAAETLIGYSAREALGQNLDLIIPTQLRAAHWRGFREAMESGVTKHHGQAVLTGVTHKDGTRIYAEVAFSLIKAEGGKAIGSVATARPKKRDA